MVHSSAADDTPRVLIVDDEKFIRDVLADFLTIEGYNVQTVSDGVEALEQITQSRFDLVISDLKMPRLGGLELIEEVSRVSPKTLTIIMTGFGTVETAIDAMKRGAYDYVLKPFKIEEVIHIIQRGIDRQRLVAENMRLKETVSLYSVSEAISASLSLEEVLATIGRTAIQEINADFVTVWLDDSKKSFVERSLLTHARLEDASVVGMLEPLILCKHLRKEKYVVQQGEESHKFFAVKPQQPLVSFLAVPLKTQRRLFGWIALGSFDHRLRFDHGHRKLFAIIAARAAASIENARLYEDLQATFQQTIQGLAKAIDKMDRYTAGHSDRVAMYAGFLARKIGLSPDLIQIVDQSALMHDIGKIGCVLNLNKPGKLTEQEYEVFKKHPQYGRDILEPIKFLHPLIPGVQLHHERWDGKGYPLGLSGTDIPLVARIIAIADAYDAMTSNRAYRRALPVDVAIREIRRCAGTQFDPELAIAFTEHIRSFTPPKRT